MNETLIIEVIVKHLAGQHDQSAHRGKKAAKKPHPWIAGLHVVSKAGKIRQAKLAAKYAGKILTPEDRQHVKAQIRGVRALASTLPQDRQQPAPESLRSVIVRGLINYAVQNPEDVRGLAGAVGGGAKKVWKKIDDPENRAEWSENERQAARKQRFWHPDNAADRDRRNNPQFYSGF